MEFISYTLFDLIGLVQGLISFKFLNEALLVGNILAPIVLLFVFLSVYKLGHTFIVKKDYFGGFKDFAFLLLFVFLFTTTSTATVYFINLTQYFVKKKVDFSIWSSDEVNPDASGVKITLKEVPSAAIGLAFIDGLAFQITKTLLDTKDLEENMIKWKLKTLPNLLFDLAFMDYVGKGKDTNERLERLFTLGYCFRVWDAEGIKEEDRKYLKDVLGDNKVNNLIKAFIEPERCDELRKEYANTVISDANRYFDNKAYVRFFEDTATAWIENSDAIPVEIQNSVARGILSSKEVIEATKSTINYPHKYQSDIQKIMNNIYSEIQYQFAKNMTSQLFWENIMYKMQQVAVYILVAIFPLVLTIAFLPVFGYNFRLIGVFLFAYFLTKLWIPLYLVAHKVLYNDMLSNMAIVISYIIPFIPTSAYAGPTEIYTFLNTTLPKTEGFNIIILNGLAMGIPSTLGFASLFMLGKSMFTSVQRAVMESSLIGKMALFSGMNAIGKLGGGLKSTNVSNINTTKAENVKLANSLAGDGTKITGFTQTDSGIYVPSSTFIKTGDLKTGRIITPQDNNLKVANNEMVSNKIIEKMGVINKW